MAEPKRTPIDAGIIARVVSGFKGFGGWFGAGKPLAPVVPDTTEQQASVAGRQYDYPTYINTQTKPRSSEAVSFEQMRLLADRYDLLRILIETRKDQIAGLEWAITNVDEKKQPDARCEAITAFFRKPDRDHNWHTWLRMVIEDLLVIDAPCIYPRKTKGGELYSLDPVDGATIKRVIDSTGRTPIAPDPAYQQILKGIPAANYTRDELIYSPRNPRTNKIYGYSPVEQVIVTVNIALHRQAHQLTYYTEGNTPNLLFSVPETWNPDQIKQFQEYWDYLMSGNPAERNKAKFVPHGVTPFDTKAAALKDEFDDWLARVMCYTFSISPQPFIKENNRATAETAQGASHAEGLQPLQLWVKSLIDDIIFDYFGCTDLVFRWKDQAAVKQLDQANIDKIYIEAKALHPDEVRERLGLDPLTPEQKEEMNPAPPPMLGGDGEQAGNSKQVKEQDKGGAVADKVVKKKSVKTINRKRDAVVVAVTGLTGVIKGLFAALAADVYEQLNDEATKVTKADPADDLNIRAVAIADGFDLSKFNDLPAQWLTHIEPLVLDGVGEAFVQIGVEPSADMLNLANEQAIEFAEARGAELVGKRWVDGVLVDNPNPKWAIPESTRDMLRSLVTETLQDGISGQELADKIKGNFAFSDSRADMIARTECALADCNANFEAYRSSGIVKGKQSLLSNIGEHGEADVLNAGQGPIPLEQPFQSGHMHTPFHPRCQCDVIPVVDDDYDQAVEDFKAVLSLVMCLLLQS